MYAPHEPHSRVITQWMNYLVVLQRTLPKLSVSAEPLWWESSCINTKKFRKTQTATDGNRYRMLGLQNPRCWSSQETSITTWYWLLFSPLCCHQGESRATCIRLYNTNYVKSRVCNSLQFAWPLDKNYLWNEMKFTRDHAKTVGGTCILWGNWWSACGGGLWGDGQGYHFTGCLPSGCLLSLRFLCL